MFNLRTLARGAAVAVAAFGISALPSVVSAQDNGGSGNSGTLTVVVNLTGDPLGRHTEHDRWQQSHRADRLGVRDHRPHRFGSVEHRGVGKRRLHDRGHLVHLHSAGQRPWPA